MNNEVMVKIKIEIYMKGIRIINDFQLLIFEFSYFTNYAKKKHPCYLDFSRSFLTW